MLYTNRKKGPSYCSSIEKLERFTSSAKVVPKSWQIMKYGSEILCYSCNFILDDKFNRPAQRLYRSARKVITFEFHLFRVYSKYCLTFAFVYGVSYTADIHNSRYCFEINYTLRDVKIIITQWNWNSNLPPFSHSFCSLYTSVLYISREFWIFTMSLERCHWRTTNIVMKSLSHPLQVALVPVGLNWSKTALWVDHRQHKHGNKPRGSLLFALFFAEERSGIKLYHSRGDWLGKPANIKLKTTVLKFMLEAPWPCTVL